MGDFIGEGMGEIKVTAYSVDTGESWDVPFKMASRGTLVYELSAVETTAADAAAAGTADTAGTDAEAAVTAADTAAAQETASQQ